MPGKRQERRHREHVLYQRIRPVPGGTRRPVVNPVRHHLSTSKSILRHTRIKHPTQQCTKAAISTRRSQQKPHCRTYGLPLSAGRSPRIRANPPGRLAPDHHPRMVPAERPMLRWSACRCDRPSAAFATTRRGRTPASFGPRLLQPKAGRQSVNNRPKHPKHPEINDFHRTLTPEE